MTISGHEPTPFVGRRRELGDLRRALSSVRCLTLVGIGGAGKTRLAQRLLQEHAEGGGRGSTETGRAWLVELAPVRDPSLVQLVVADAIGVRPQPGERQVPAICQFLGGEAAVLVLDNCEHLLDACAGLVSDLLSECPGLKVITTSRQPLGIAGELVYRVPPLSLPGPGDELRWRDLAQYESVALFVSRAATALPGFKLDVANADAVARLCVALEGIPLALELAAARIRTLSPSAMLDRIEQRYQLLSRGYVDVPDRQRSLQASVDWSHELCTPAERTLWARLSVFSGGFDLEAAETVCAGPDLPSGEILDVLSSLVDKSLVHRDLHGEEPHYLLLETIREYGAARLQLEDDPATWQRRHRDYFAHLTRRFHDEWVGPRQPELIAMIRRNHANVQAALERAAAHLGDAAVVLRMAVDLEEYWAVTGLLTEARHWLDTALARGSGTPYERVHALSMCAYLAGLQLHLDYADERLAEARDALGRSDGPAEDPARARAAASLHFAEGVHGFYRGRIPEALDHCRRTVELLESIGEPHGQPAAHVVIGVCLSALGRLDEARSAQSRVLELTEHTGELHIRGLALWALSADAREAGDLDRAADLVRRSLEAQSRLGDRTGIALSLESMASITAERGDALRAAVLLGAASSLWQRTGLDPMAGQYVEAQRDVAEHRAREQLDERAFDTAVGRGRRLSEEQAVDQALGRDELAPDDVLRDSPLTPREREVATLIGEGLSNQQIASRLVISVRTAHGHVENILRKLEFSSRTQVAAWVVGRSLQQSRATDEPAGDARRPGR